MNNYVAKHNYNRASTHKSVKDYSRQRMSLQDIEPPSML
jgi:hypothetical protein